ncbi:MEDS domain-containing protein [Saccharothrix obliqua]|uniref:MEDS domain-containing protein n=1 Tax=Saccharothrix obliqua TaxID=2861747 RepID=UPI0027E296E0|nr:MEDS domain-containing protein [Saccharothrix obliqua]
MYWAYEDHGQFHRHAREFIGDGLRLGQQVWYVAPGDTSALAADLRGIDGVEEALRIGAAKVVSLDSTHPANAVIDPVAQAGHYAAATRNAVTAGFTGLRVVRDWTTLVRNARQAAAFARYEHVLDQYTAALPFSAMCAYHHQVGEDVVARAACLHPIGNATAAGFRLFGSTEAALALDGELDCSSGDLFAEALRLADPRPVAGRLVVDATGLRFLDHNCLLRLTEHAARHDATLVLRTAWPGAARLVDALDLTCVEVETAA